MIYLLAAGLDAYLLRPQLNQWRRGVRELWLMFEDKNQTEIFSKLNLLICDLFDRIYGHDHFSEKRLGRSILSSLVGIAIFSVFIGVDQTVGAVYEIAGENRISMLVFYAILLTIIPILFNFIPDYISLIETRIILDYARGKGPLVVIALIFVDLIITTIVFLVGVSSFLLLFSAIVKMERTIVKDLGLLSQDFFSIEFYRMLLFETQFGQILFLTTFVTSFFWILFVIVYVLAFLFYKMSKFSNFVFYQLTKTDKPVTIIATGLNLFILFIYLVVSFIGN